MQTGKTIPEKRVSLILPSLFVITFLQFVSAATGIACLVGLFNGLKHKTTNNLGKLWSIFIKTITRILLPLCIVMAVFLAFNGTPASYDGKDSIITLQGDTVQVSRGPAAGMIAIKHLGTNGGGWFNANSTHPLENPNYFTNMLEVIAQVLLPIALIFALGFYIKRKKFAYVIFGVIAIGLLCLVIPTVVSEIHGNPEITKMGISQVTGAMERRGIASVGCLHLRPMIDTKSAADLQRLKGISDDVQKWWWNSEVP